GGIFACARRVAEGSGGIVRHRAAVVESEHRAPKFRQIYCRLRFAKGTRSGADRVGAGEGEEKRDRRRASLQERRARKSGGGKSRHESDPARNRSRRSATGNRERSGRGATKPIRRRRNFSGRF